MTRSADRGFTLIELMVVMLIIAVLLSVVTLSMRPAESKRLEQQALAFQGLLQSMCDQALLRNRVLGLVPDADRPQIYVFTPPGQALFDPVDAQENAPEKKTELSNMWKIDNKLNAEPWEVAPESVGLERDGQGAGSPFAMPENGWRCFPEGLMDAGQIVFATPSRQVVLEWTRQQTFRIFSQSDSATRLQ